MESHGLVSFSSRSSQPSPFWWEGAPALYPVFKARMLKHYPDAHDCIDNLLPVGFASGDIGLGGAITTIGSITAYLMSNEQHWVRRARQWNQLLSPAPVHRTLYETALRENAELLFPAWQGSEAERGWVAVEIEPNETHSAVAMLRRARQLANLMPNIMVSVPLSEIGCEVIEELVATGHAINASQCFSVAQVRAGLAAIRRGRQRAVSQGVCLKRTRHLISVSYADFMAHPEFTLQAAQLGIELSATEQRWAEVALYRALCSAMLGYSESTWLRVSGLAPDPQGALARGWASAGKTQEPVLYSASEQQVEALIGGVSATQSNLAAVPGEVMQRLLRVPAFRQVWGADSLSSACFARHPVFLQGAAHSLRTYTRLLGFARPLGPSLYGDTPAPNMSACGWAKDRKKT